MILKSAWEISKLSIKYNKILVLDLELTCWEDPRPEDMEIIQIGTCILDMKTGEIENPLSSIVRPYTADISEYCTNLTGITKAMIVKQGRPLSERLNTLQKEYGLVNKPWGAWGTDDRHLRRECKSKNIQYPFNGQYVNIKQLYAFYKNSSKGTGLAKAIRQLDLEFWGTEHDAMSDAVNAAKVMKEIFCKKGA